MRIFSDVPILSSGAIASDLNDSAASAFARISFNGGTTIEPTTQPKSASSAAPNSKQPRSDGFASPLVALAPQYRRYAIRDHVYRPGLVGSSRVDVGA